MNINPSILIAMGERKQVERGEAKKRDKGCKETNPKAKATPKVKVKDEPKEKCKEAKSKARAVANVKVKDEPEAKAEAKARRLTIDDIEYVPAQILWAGLMN